MRFNLKIDWTAVNNMEIFYVTSVQETTAVKIFILNIHDTNIYFPK